MASHMEAASLERFLVHILTPVYRLIEDDTIRDSQMGKYYHPHSNSLIWISCAEELKTTAVELQDLVQSKVGTTKFSLVYNQIRQSALSIRRKRKVAKALQLTTNSEAAAKRNIQRNINKKESRKRKDPGFLYVPFIYPFHEMFLKPKPFSDGKRSIKRHREE